VHKTALASRGVESLGAITLREIQDFEAATVYLESPGNPVAHAFLSFANGQQIHKRAVDLLTETKLVLSNEASALEVVANFAAALRKAGHNWMVVCTALVTCSSELGALVPRGHALHPSLQEACSSASDQLRTILEDALLERLSLDGPPLDCTVNVLGNDLHVLLVNVASPSRPSRILEHTPTLVQFSQSVLAFLDRLNELWNANETGYDNLGIDATVKSLSVLRSLAVTSDDLASLVEPCRKRAEAATSASSQLLWARLRVVLSEPVATLSSIPSRFETLDVCVSDPSGTDEAAVTTLTRVADTLGCPTLKLQVRFLGWVREVSVALKKFDSQYPGIANYITNGVRSYCFLAREREAPLGARIIPNFKPLQVIAN